jgi:hypothetical protein
MASATGLTDSSGFWLSTRTSNVGNTHKYIRNSSILGTATTSAGVLVSSNIQIGALSGNYFSNKEVAFSSIGDGLTDSESTNFYTSVQKFNTTLGRQVGTPYVSDSDAQSFLNVAGITDLTQAGAINTLVTDLKTAGIWTKMKAIYPFVGGTATSHKFNLKDSRDLDTAFRLIFNGGWTHASTGAKPNGTTGYADTKFTPSTNLTANSAHQSFYFRTNKSISSNTAVYGAYTNFGSNNFLLYPYSFGIGWISDIFDNSTSRIVSNAGDSTGHIIATRASSSSHKMFRNNSVIASTTNATTGTYPSINYYIGAGNKNGTPGDYDNNELAFSSLGDGLTDSESSTFYSAVQKYQTSLGRQVGTPVLASGQTAGLLDTYSSATVAYSLRKLRNGYYGFAIRVRRSSDNAEQDIAFKTDGTLDTTSLLAFVGAGNGFVTTWYDQSGNGYNAYQSTAINQPLIVSSGSLTTNGGKPAIRCAGSTGLLINQISLGTTHSMFAVIDWSGSNKEYFGSFGNSWAFYQVDGEYKASGAVGRTNAAFTTNRFLGTLLRVNTQLQYYQNSATLGSTFTINANNVFNLSNLIGEDYSYGFTGDQQEAIIYTSSMASSRTAIESNINSYYSIY